MSASKNLFYIVFFTYSFLLQCIKTSAQPVDSVLVVPMSERQYNEMEIGFVYLPSFASFKLNTKNGIETEGEPVSNNGFGLFCTYNFTKHIGLELQVLYNSFSKKYDDAYLKRTVNLHYISLPLLFVLSTNKSLPASINVVFGPQTGFNAASNSKVISPEAKDSLLGTFAVKPIDIGIAYGAGLDLSFSKSQRMHIGIGYRAYYGLTNINNYDARGSSYSILSKGNLRTYSAYFSLRLAF
jgi:hypothetical protein